MILTMPWPVTRGLSPNHRVHWSQKARAKKSLRAAWAWEATKQGARKLDASALSVAITFVPPDRRARDMDNMLASCKAGLDGLADVLGVDDRHWSLSLAVSKEIGGFVRIEVSHAE
ncbi:MAG TPA: hypothetical protein VIN03_16630 [Roseateles sp.]